VAQQSPIKENELTKDN